MNRPIASGNIKISSAIIYAGILLVMALFIIFNYNFNTNTKILILVINLPLMILYTPFFKKIPLIGNIVVALILSMVFVVTTTYLNGDIYLILPPAILSFLLK